MSLLQIKQTVGLNLLSVLFEAVTSIKVHLFCNQASIDLCPCNNLGRCGAASKIVKYSAAGILKQQANITSACRICPSTGVTGPDQYAIKIHFYYAIRFYTRAKLVSICERYSQVCTSLHPSLSIGKGPYLYSTSRGVIGYIDHATFPSCCTL